MSVAGIATTGMSQLANVQRNYQQVRKEFSQLGQDLQAGNLTQAQTDFVTLSQSMATQLSSNSPIAKVINSLGQALQSGNLSAAQQAFSAMQQLWQQMGTNAATPGSTSGSGATAAPATSGGLSVTI